MSLIELKGASVWLETHRVLKDLHWKLEPGAHFAVLGGNGAGKSTFLRLLAGQIWPRPHDSRIYEFQGHRSWSPLRARENIALLSPETQERFVRHLQDGADNEKGWQLNAREAILAGHFNSELLHQKPSAQQESQSDAVLAQLNLTQLAERPLQTLSQGQMRRVLLARALVSQPELLLLDESCSGLDASSRDEMLEIIENIARSGQTTVGLTTHRESEIVPSIRSILTLRDGEFAHGEGYSHAAPHPVLALPVHDATHHDGLEPLLKIENTSVFIEGTPILADLNWELQSGQHFAVEGGNGAGKTTFFRLLRGELHPSFGGKIHRFGEEKMARAVIGAKISLLSPALQARYADDIPVEVAVASGFFDSFGVNAALTEEQVEQTRDTIIECGLEALVGRSFKKLSYGQRRRVLLARALVTSPRILLLDEALDGLDAASRAQWNGILAKYAARGTSLIVISHHSADYPPFLTHVLTLEQGRITAQIELTP